MLKSECSLVFSERRKRLMQQFPETTHIYFGASEVRRNAKHTYPFRQDSNFLYLTGFSEPDAVLILHEGKDILFIQPRIEVEESWNGERYGRDRAQKVFHFQEVFENSEWKKFLTNALKASLKKKNEVQLSFLPEFNRGFPGELEFAYQTVPGLIVQDATRSFAAMRMKKDRDDLKALRLATQITVEAHLSLLKFAKAGMSERDLEIEFEYQIKRRGASALGYQTIVGSGKNATTLHYVHNNETLKAGELVLVDAGAEYEGFTGDLTQTFPVGPRFSPRQKEIYEAVLKVNQEIRRRLKPGETYRRIHRQTLELMTDAALALGLIHGNRAELLKTKAVISVFPHGVGHHLGLDVHDLSYHELAEEEVLLEPGMVLTVEPGFYVRDPKSPDCGIGIRIEDDVLITENGSETLTLGLPRTVDEIEAIRASI